MGSRAAGARLDPDDLARQGVEPLRRAVRIARPAPVAERGVEVAVGADLDLSALVVEAPMRQADDEAARARQRGQPCCEPG